MSDALTRETGDPAFSASLVETRPHLFSDVAVFISAAQLEAMQCIVAAIETVVRHPAYRAAVLDWAPASAQRDFGPRGMFMGYDFHMGSDGPALIEINTNAGGAMLNAVLARAQQSCCVPATSDHHVGNFDGAVAHMVRAEWVNQRGSGCPAAVAIVDDDPAGQFLYPEFLLAQRLLERHGYHVVIADPSELEYRSGNLRHDGGQIDLVYNRLVDFSLDAAGHSALRQAYLDGAVVVTPNPHIHAMFADKRNLTLLSDPALLRRWGIEQDLIDMLAQGVPATERVTPAVAERLWTDRKRQFFKPASGYGSKATYRGDKLTKSVWAEILRGDYVAQDFVRPSERLVRLDGELRNRKIDIRLYTYDGEVLLAAARLYQGQTTNMHTAGGGFAPVLSIPGNNFRGRAQCAPPERIEAQPVFCSG
ncbi:hypothetical protein [Sphingobium sp. MK2]|uniref:hypothetical protein n=1 Tax=Sphingobium sp. MK2 TaxID=3116540 RepID=UPI0032E358F6